MGIAYVDVATYMLNAVGQLPPQRGRSARLDVVYRQALRPLRPDRNAFEKGARPIGSRLPNGQRRIEVDVRFHQRCGDQPSTEVDHLRGDMSKALTVHAHKFSGKAAEKIAAAGGVTEQLA